MLKGSARSCEITWPLFAKVHFLPEFNFQVGNKSYRDTKERKDIGTMQQRWTGSLMLFAAWG